jgi:hypothetical protein
MGIGEKIIHKEIKTSSSPYLIQLLYMLQFPSLFDFVNFAGFFSVLLHNSRAKDNNTQGKIKNL